MKTTVSILTLLSFLGGWFYFELMPYPPEKRVWHLQQMPVVKVLTNVVHKHKAKAAFRDAPDGTITFPLRDRDVTWHSYNEWEEAFENDDGPAIVWIYSLRYVEMSKEWKKNLEQKVLTGELGSLISFMGTGATHLADGTSLSDALRATDTHKGRYYAAFNDNRDRKEAFSQSREGMLLAALMTRENLPDSWNSGDEKYSQQTARAQIALDAMSRSAHEGNPDAQWVIGRLNGDTEVRIHVPDQTR